MSYVPVKNYTNTPFFKVPNSVFKSKIELQNIYYRNNPLAVTSDQYVCPLEFECTNKLYAGASNVSYVEWPAIENTSANNFKPDATGTTYNSLAIFTTPVIAYVKIAQLKTKIDPTKYYYPLTGYPQGMQIKTKNIVYSGAEFLSSHGNDYIVDDVILYDNTVDGNRTKCPYNFHDMYLRYTFTKLESIYSRNTESVDGDFLMPIFNGFFTSTLYGISYDQFTFFTSFNQTAFCEYDTNTLLNSNAPQTKTYRAFTSLAYLKQCLNKIGVPFTFSLSEAIGTPTTKFPDYIPSGQPTDTTGGGDGGGDNSSDTVENNEPNVTSISAFNANYAVSKSMLSSLAEYLWTASFLDNIKLLFNDPAEAIICCHMYPFSLTDHDTSHVGAQEYLKIGNVTTPQQGYPILNGYNSKFSGGTITIPEYYGSALDYEPYTHISIYLPYIGIKDLKCNEVMGKTISIIYILDIGTGVCVVELWCDSLLLYTFDGKVGIDIPISSTNASSQKATMALNAISTVGSMAMGVASGNPLIVAGSLMSTAQNVANNKIHVNKGGIASPSCGLYMPQTPYVIVERPIQSKASSFGAVKGFPCNVTKILTDIKGYTEIDTPVLTNIQATEEEKAQIKNLLENGVIIA